MKTSGCENFIKVFNEDSKVTSADVVFISLLSTLNYSASQSCASTVDFEHLIVWELLKQYTDFFSKLKVNLWKQEMVANLV